MMPEYAGAIWSPAHPSNYRAIGRSTWDRIITHITDGHGDPRAVAAMWRVPQHGSSAHFVIGQDGTILQCVSLGNVAYHAHAANGHSVGIEHCARAAGELSGADPGLAISQAQYAASAKLQAWLCRVAGLPPTRMTCQGHAEADPATSHADCPTAQWRWETFMPLLVQEYTAFLDKP